MRKLMILLLIGLLANQVLNAQNYDIRNYQTTRINGEAPRLDGNLIEEVWEQATWESDFLQHEPEEGKVASQKTSFAVVYDDNFIYIALRAYDNNPDSIVQRMTRRDAIDGDQMGVQFDSYFDKRTAFTFIVSAAGVKHDFLMSNDGESEDLTWDPIWWVKTAKNAEGWTAEMKIPLTQLRFGKADEQTWGFQVARNLFRKNELSLWQPISRKASGWVSQLGTINGLKIKPKKQLDITPYITSSIESYSEEEGNPYADGSDFGFNGGVDGKIGITNNFTLDFTINPDFGQVEADPSEVNLTAYESFFSEQRPFFIEGRNILSYPLMFGDGDMAAESLFYTRRIGRKPRYYPELTDDEYMKMPKFTSILGAAKITGKTPNGWSVGILESVTSEEKAKITNANEEREEVVEPLTNYFVARLQRDWNKGNTIIGGVLTSVNRNIETENLDFIPESAYTGGIDFSQYFKDKAYYIKINTYWSNIKGSTTAISEAQRSPVRYFQRPDAEYLKIDETLTSLSGSGGNFQVGKNNGKLKFMLSGSMKSPSLEVNDIGYLQSVDDIMQVFWVGYRVYEPFSIFRNFNINFNQWSGWDFGGNHTYLGGNVNAHTQFKNYWHLSMGTNINSNQVSNAALRGGESIRLPGGKNAWIYLGSNSQKKFMVSGNVRFYGASIKSYSTSQYYSLDFTYIPVSTLSITLSPNFNKSKKELQYIDQLDYNNSTRYLFGSLDQQIAGMSIRINYNITPNLSIQYWGQPFVAAGSYEKLKYITNPHAEDYTNRFAVFADNQITFDSDNNEYVIDENLDNLEDYRIYKPDFNFKEFLSNMVLKWEYAPGSTLYLVWSQSRSEYIENGMFDLQSDLGNLFDVEARNVFLVKFSYRIGLR
jgi:hypothetical protein